jgi:hypothetical protein
MKQRIATRVAIAAAGVAALVPAAWAQIRVEVDGQPVRFTAAGPQQVQGRVLVPLRGVLEQLGAYVSWDAGNREVTATRAGTDIRLRIGERTAFVNGRPTMLDVPATIYRGTTMVPLRFMSEALGADVEWVAQQQLVRIAAPTQHGMPVQPPPTQQPPIQQPPVQQPPVQQDVRIDSFEVDRTGFLRAGTVVRATLRGTPGGQASFHIPGVAPEIPMRETQSGQYVGEWTVPGGQALTFTDAAAIGRLRANGTERLIQAAGRFTIDTQPPVVRGMTPDPGSRVVRSRPNISAAFDAAGGSAVQPDTVRVLLDGRDVTAQANVTPYFVSLQPQTTLAMGEHRVEVSGRDQAGNEFRQAWSFFVAEGGEAIQSFTHDAPARPEPGDVVTLTLRGEPGATAVFSIGELVTDRQMREVEPGRYVGEYTIRRGDALANQPIRARLQTRGGQVFTVQAERGIGMQAGPLQAPQVTSHQPNQQVRSPLTLEGTAPPNSRVQVRIEHRTMVLGALPMGGTIAERVVDVDADGRWRTAPIPLDTLVRGSNTEYTVTLVALVPGAEPSEPVTLRLRG